MRWRRGQHGIERQVDLTLTRINGGSSSKPGTHKAEPTVSIVIPAKNEALNLPHVFATLDTERYEVILVDGDSVDDTVDVARELCPDVIVVGQTRKGKGNALACGFAVAKGDFIVMLATRPSMPVPLYSCAAERKFPGSLFGQNNSQRSPTRRKRPSALQSPSPRPPPFRGLPTQREPSHLWWFAPTSAHGPRFPSRLL